MSRVSGWPELGPPEDPWAEPPPAAGPRAAVLERLDAVVRGQVPTPDAELARLARAEGLLGPLPSDPTPCPPVPRVPSVSDMARVAADFQPDRGDWPDLLLGPWFETLDARVPAHHAALQVALAATCFLELDADRSPFLDLCRRKPIPEPPVRAAFRAVDRAPLAVWGLRAAHGDRWELEDRLGLSPNRLPAAPVQLHAPGAVNGGPRAGDTLVARVVHTTGGPVATTALIVRGAPPEGLLRSWVAVEALRARVHDPEVTLEALLRRRGHVLARRVHEWAWLQ